MPSASVAQHRLMGLAANSKSWGKSKGEILDINGAKEFVKAKKPN